MCDWFFLTASCAGVPGAHGPLVAKHCGGRGRGCARGCARHSQVFHPLMPSAGQGICFVVRPFSLGSCDRVQPALPGGLGSLGKLSVSAAVLLREGWEALEEHRQFG